jgi:hypothetical protein
MKVLLVYPATPETFWNFKHVRGLAPRAPGLLAILHHHVAPTTSPVARGGRTCDHRSPLPTRGESAVKQDAERMVLEAIAVWRGAESVTCG